MVLVFDVGNTNIVLGVFRNKELVAHWRLSTCRNRTSDEYGITLKDLFDTSGLEMKSIKAVVISTVVPPLTYILDKACQKYFNVTPIMVGPGIKTGLSIKYENPREVGADRIVNAVAGLELYGGPLIIVDFGTATTFCAISAGESTGWRYARASTSPRKPCLPRRPSCPGWNWSSLPGLLGGIRSTVCRRVFLRFCGTGR